MARGPYITHSTKDCKQKYVSQRFSRARFKSVSVGCAVPKQGQPICSAEANQIILHKPSKHCCKNVSGLKGLERVSTTVQRFGQKSLVEKNLLSAGKDHGDTVAPAACETCHQCYQPTARAKHQCENKCHEHQCTASKLA